MLREGRFHTDLCSRKAYKVVFTVMEMLIMYRPIRDVRACGTVSFKRKNDFRLHKVILRQFLILCDGFAPPVLISSSCLSPTSTMCTRLIFCPTGGSTCVAGRVGMLERPILRVKTISG
jgi:hypothetical protein